MLFLKLLTLHPGIKCGVHLVLPNLKKVFGVLATCFLQAPRRRVVEVELIVNMTMNVVATLHVDAKVDLGEGGQSSLNRVRAVVVVLIIPPVQEIVNGITSDRLLWVVAGIDDGERIKDDVVLFVAHVEALLYCRLQIDVLNGATVHQDETMEVLWWEDNRD